MRRPGTSLRSVFDIPPADVPFQGGLGNGRYGTIFVDIGWVGQRR